MANPLVNQYQLLADNLDPLIEDLDDNGKTASAQEVESAQSVLRAACISLLANDIDDTLDPNDPTMAKALAEISTATNALATSAAAIARSVNNISKIVAIASNAEKIASSLVPPNISQLIASASDTTRLL